MKIFTKKTNAQLVQINEIDEEHFQTQSSNDLVENNTYNDIKLNQTQSKEHRT